MNYSDTTWARQPATEKEVYYHKAWKWFARYANNANDARIERFPKTVQTRLGKSPHANSRIALLSSIYSFDKSKLRRVHTHDRSAPRLVG